MRKKNLYIEPFFETNPCDRFVFICMGSTCRNKDVLCITGGKQLHALLVHVCSITLTKGACFYCMQ